MHERPPSFHTLVARNPAAGTPVLNGVHARGRLDAALFELTLRQTYRNTGDSVLEVIYTFPLPATAVLLGFASELNGARREGVVVARRRAEQQYEASLADGDAPVLLEAHHDGVHTANIGNLKPGDELVVECRYAQVLTWEQGRLRVSLPTTIAPRYGDPAGAGLHPQQEPAIGLHAEYPLDLALTIGPALAGAAVACPTHPASVRTEPDGSIELRLDAPARLDRDVVVLVTPREPHPSLLVRTDDACNPAAPVVLMAALTPRPGTSRDAVAVKALVDCSGSMQGDSIASAGAALRGLAVALTGRDRLSLTRYGSSVEHVLAPAPAGPALLPRLQPMIDGLRADLGGTETAQALREVFEIPVDTPAGAAADVLLITDGEIWETAPSIEAARRSGHRVFVIGVGSAPAEGFLRTLAESTGGACEFATPGEALQAAARRMLERIRQPRLSGLRIDWGAEPAWSVEPGPSLFGGDTVIAMAGFSAPPRGGTPVRLLADDPHGGPRELARGEADAPCPGDSLARLAAARRLSTLADADAQAHAVRYQLMSAHTACILVHERAEAERAVEEARLHRVESMLAAGWGGTGTVLKEAPVPMFCMSVDPAWESLFDPSTSMPMRAAPAEPLEALPATPRSRPKSRPASPGPATLAELARTVADHLTGPGSPADLLPRIERLEIHPDVHRVIRRAVRRGLTAAQAWIVIAHWVHLRWERAGTGTMHPVLDRWMQTIDPALAASAADLCQMHLGQHGDQRWEVPRWKELVAKRLPVDWNS